MRLSRRTALTVLGGTALGYTSASAAGAFDQVELDRSIDVSVEVDQDAALRIIPHEDVDSESGPIVDFDENGEIYIDLTPQPLNRNGITRYDSLLRVSNHGSNTVELTVELLVGGTTVSPYATVYPDGDPGASIGTLPAGVSVPLGIEFDVDDPAEIESIDTMRFTAVSV